MEINRCARWYSGVLPVSPAERAAVETFRTWLRMDETDRDDAIRLDPKWRRWYYGNVL